MQISTKTGGKLTLTEQLIASVDMRSMQPEKIRAVCEKLGIPVAGQGNDAMLVIGHHFRMKCPDATPKEKSDSESWLRFRNLI